MWWCGDVNRQTCWTKKPMGLGGDCRQAKQKDKHLVVVVWGCQQVNMLNKEASGVGWGGEGTDNQQTCWTKRPVPCCGRGVGGGGLSTSRLAEQRGQYLVVAGGGGGDCQQVDMLNKGQYLVVVGVPTSKLNKEASTLLWWGCQQAS